MVVDSTNDPQITPQEQVRRRPDLFVGGTTVEALHQLAYEIMNHAINAALAGECEQIWITLHADDMISIRDDGPGIYTDELGDSGRSFLELLLTDVGFHLKQRAKALLEYKVEGGMHGVGLAAMNALCDQLRVETMYRQVVWEQSYRRGIPVTEVAFVRRLEKGESNGTVITFQPDATIFETTHFDYDVLAERAQELAVLMPNLTLVLRDERGSLPQEQIFHFDDGMRQFIQHLTQEAVPLHEPLLNHYSAQVAYASDVPYSVTLDFAFVYTDSEQHEECSYINTVLAPEGGVHVRAIYSALTDLINEKAREFNLLPEAEPDFVLQEIQPGLITLLNMRHPDPQFAGAMKKYLANPETYGVVAGAVYQTEIPTDTLERIVTKCLDSRRKLD